MVDYGRQRYKFGYDAETSHGAGGTPTNPIDGKIQNVTWEALENPLRIGQLGSRTFTKTVLGEFNLRGQLNWTLGYGFGIGVHLVGPKSGAGSTASPYVLTEAAEVGYAGSVIKTFLAQVSNDRSTDDVDMPLRKAVHMLLEHLGLSMEESVIPEKRISKMPERWRICSRPSKIVHFPPLPE